MTTFLVLWFAAAILSAAWVAYDVTTGQPEIMRVMKIAWVLITLYLGVLGLVLYVTSCREPAAGDHEQFVAPMWKQALGSSVHCVAGDALGIVVVAAITAMTSLSMFVDFGLEYGAAFLFGWLIFQVGPIMALQGQTFRQALKGAFAAEFLSLTTMVIGMFPTMYWLMGMGGGGAHMAGPGTLRFWGTMAAGIAVGFLFTYPVNWWMVAAGWKHGMGSVSVMGRGGHRMSTIGGQAMSTAGGQAMK